MGTDFSAGAGAGSSTDLIPNGQMAWVVIAFRETKISKTSGGRMADLELTIDDGQPYARRKLWYNLLDPMDTNHKPGGREMGMAALTRILEAHRWGGRQEAFNEDWFKANGGYVVDSYQPHDPSFAGLHLMRAAVKIKVKPAENGYAEGNDIAEFLSPNPKSASFKSYEKLRQGIYNATAQPAAAQGSLGFGAAAAPAFTTPAQPASGGFGAAQATAQPAATFAPQGGQPVVGGTHFGASSPTSTAAQTPAHVASPAAASAYPSSPAPVMGAGAGWLQQAQQPAG
jgi:hypothetical protein